MRRAEIFIRHRANPTPDSAQSGDQILLILENYRSVQSWITPTVLSERLHDIGNISPQMICVFKSNKGHSQRLFSFKCAIVCFFDDFLRLFLDQPDVDAVAFEGGRRSRGFGESTTLIDCKGH
jgi:hypothetical protein